MSNWTPENNVRWTGVKLLRPRFWKGKTRLKVASSLPCCAACLPDCYQKHLLWETRGSIIKVKNRRNASNSEHAELLQNSILAWYFRPTASGENQSLVQQYILLYLVHCTHRYAHQYCTLMLAYFHWKTGAKTYTWYVPESTLTIDCAKAIPKMLQSYPSHGTHRRIGATYYVWVNLGPERSSRRRKVKVQ